MTSSLRPIVPLRFPPPECCGNEWSSQSRCRLYAGLLYQSQNGLVCVPQAACVLLAEMDVITMHVGEEEEEDTGNAEKVLRMTIAAGL